MSLPEMMKAINEGDFDYVSRQQFTVVEGATVPQAAEAMAKELPFTKDEILAAWADKTYLNKLINKYWFLTDEILADGICIRKRILSPAKIRASRKSQP